MGAVEEGEEAVVTEAVEAVADHAAEARVVAMAAGMEATAINLFFLTGNRFQDF